MRWRTKAVFGLVSTATFLMVSGLALLAPALPALADERQLSMSEAGWILSAFALGRLLFSIPSGMFADRLGFPRAAVCGCLLTGTAATVAALQPVFWGLLLAQVVQGAGSAIHTTSALSSIISALPEGRMARLLSIHQGIVMLGVSLSPVMGGVAVTVWGVAGPFWLYAGTTSLALMLSMVAVRLMPRRARKAVPTGEPDSAARRQAVARMLGNRTFVLSLCVTFVLFWMVAGIRNTVVPLFAQIELSFTPLLVGVLLGAAACANGVCLFVAGAAADRLGRRPVLLTGTVTLLAGLLGLSVASDTTLWVCVVVLGVGMGFAGAALPAILVDVVDVRIRGVAVGISRTASGLGLFVGPMSAGLLLESLSFRETLALAAGALGLASAAVLLMRETMTAVAPHPSSIPVSRPDERHDVAAAHPCTRREGAT